jgi:hypothetical protein
MNSLTALTPQQLRRAADIQERIQSLQKELGQIFGAVEAAPRPSQISGNGRRRKRMSAAGRAAIAAAARARWKKAKAAGRNRL